MSCATATKLKPRGVSGHRFRVLQIPVNYVDGAPLDVPLDLLAPHRIRAERNHGHDLTELDRRGGLIWAEMLAVLEEKQTTPIPATEAFARVKAIAAERGIDI
jgi:hypothetical protein